MRIKAEIDETELDNERGRSVAGVTATCSRCGHVTQSFGTEEPSVKRCLAILNAECPNGENNFYIGEFSASESDVDISDFHNGDFYRDGYYGN